MPSSTVNICVLALVLLSFQQICLSRPHSRSARGLVKHYFVPDSLVFSSDEFEKGADGKYYLKKSAHKSDSEVKYSAEDGLSEGVKKGDVETMNSESGNQAEIVKTEPLREQITERVVVEEAPLKSTTPLVEEVKVSKEVDLPKLEAIVEETTKKFEIDNEKAPFTPVDPKFIVPPKPDSKDEIPLRTDLPPIDVEEKFDEKIAIGQVPQLYPHVVQVPGNFRLPILIPVHKMSYGAVSIIPVPQVDGSDRLPLPYEDDIVGEGPHESEPVEEISHSIAEEKKDTGYNPLMRMHLPFFSFRTFLKDLKDVDKEDAEKQSKVVDVLGKKFLMQSSSMKHPTGDNSHMYVRFMSVKPLEEVEPGVPKEAAKAIEKGTKEAKREDAKGLDVKKEAEILKKSEAEILKKSEAEILKKEAEILKKAEADKEAEILKAEETEIKVKVDQEVPKEVVYENMGNPDLNMKENGEDPKMKKAEVIKSEVGEPKMFKIEDSVFVSEESSYSTESKEAGTEDSMEKRESEVLDKRMDYGPKVDPESGEGKVKSNEGTDEKVSLKEDEKKMESTDALKKGDTEKTVELDYKKIFFLVENNKQKSAEESEEHEKHKKKSEKKKKKCKCEEKDSDSDDDDK